MTLTEWPHAHPCGCNLETGRCDRHQPMMSAIRSVYKEGNDWTLFAKVWAESDGYGVPGLVPPQGFDWSGIRDSSPAAIERMFWASQHDFHGGAAGSFRDEGCSLCPEDER